MTAYSLCKNGVKDLEDVLRMEFGTIITYLELGKCEEEVSYLMNEVAKNKLKTK